MISKILERVIWDDFMELVISRTIRDIDEKEWENLAGKEYIERSHGWYKTIEDAGIRDMRYVFLKEKETLVGAACSYIYTERKFLLEMPFLDVVSFFSPRADCTRTLLDGLGEIKKREKAKGALFLFLKEEEFNTINPHLAGGINLPLKDETYLSLNFASFDEYLHSLDEEAWRSARMTLKRARKEFKVKTVFTTDFSRWKDECHRLQGYLCQKHGDFRTHFPPHFYEAVQTNLRDHAELMLFFKDDVLIAFGLPFFSPTIAEHKLIGLDPEYRKYQAYFLFYYEGIRRALERGQKKMYFGSTTYAFKEKIGCKREKLYGLAKFDNPAFHSFFRLVAAGYNLVDRDF
jgi:predicted N-acyltransferase